MFDRNAYELQIQDFDILIRSRNKNTFPVNVSHSWEKRNFKAGEQIAIKDIIELKTSADQNLYRDKNASGT